jgi:VWFA-related protein
MRRRPARSLPPLLAAPALALAFAALAAAPASAQSAAAPQAAAGTPSLFVERVDVNVVNVEVFVTDRDGTRVSGLTREDFEIFEDGRPVAISNFYAEVWADPLASPPAPEPGKPAPPPPPRRQAPPEQRLHLLVFVDHANLNPEQRLRALTELEGFIEDRVIDGDRLMLAEFNRTFRLVEPFTDDLDRLFGAVDRMGKETAGGSLREAQRRQLMTSMTVIAQNVDANTARSAYQMVRSYVEQEVSEVRRAVEALERAVRSLAGLPGRKAVLYVSGGLAQRPGEEIYQYFQDLFGQLLIAESNSAAFIDPASEALAVDQNHLFDELTRVANAYQVTLYTLDAARAEEGFTRTADNGFGTGGTNDTPRVALDALRAQSLMEPMVEMAAATGGTAIVNTANFDDGLAALATDFDSYYSLGYAAPGGGDGRFHEIEVRVKRPGLRVRHRAGYVDHPRAERVADRTLSSLVLDLESNPLGVAVDFGEPKQGKKDRWQLPVMVRVPLRELTLLPQNDQRLGQVQFYLVVKDEKGGVSELHRHPYPVAVPEAQAGEILVRDLGYYATLELRPGRPVVAVGVWDELAGTESFVQKQVIVGEGPEPRGRDRGGRRRGR